MTSFIAQKAQEAPEEIALRDDRVALRWAEVLDRLNRGAWVIDSLKLGEGARIAVIAPNSAEVLLAHVTALVAGKATVPINYRLRPEEIAQLLAVGRIEAVLAGPETADVAVEAARLAGVGHVLGWRCAGREGIADWDALTEAADAGPFTPLGKPQPTVLFTSGTTGTPKAIELPQAMFPRTETLDEHLAELARTDALGGLGPHLVVGPLYHTGPLGAYRLLAIGTPVVVLPRFDALRALQAIDAHHVGSAVFVPTHFTRLLALPEQERARYDMSSLRFVGHTGAPCPQDVKRAMIAWWGNVLFENYGATEIGGVARISSEEWLRYPGSVGRARERFAFHIVDENGQPVPAGTEGRVYLIDSLGLGIEYENDPEKTAAAHLRPGVFTLGEVGYVNADGYLFLTDRFSDMIISGGANIFPAEAEKVLIEHPGIADVACIGTPDADLGEVLHALVVPADPALGAEAVLEFCRARLSLVKCPRKVTFVKDVTRNAMGKINKRALRIAFLEGQIQEIQEVQT